MLPWICRSKEGVRRSSQSSLSRLLWLEKMCCCYHPEPLRRYMYRSEETCSCLLSWWHSHLILRFFNPLMFCCLPVLAFLLFSWDSSIGMYLVLNKTVVFKKNGRTFLYNIHSKFSFFVWGGLALEMIEELQYASECVGPLCKRNVLLLSLTKIYC